MYETLESLIKINTINDKNNSEFIEKVSQMLKDLGFKLEKVSDISGKSALIAKNRDECELCFLGHSDTVDYSDTWDSNPFELTIKDDYMYGLGVCDMKGGIACLIETLKQINLESLNKGIMLVITFDEEIGFGGINLVKNISMPNNILIGEPTDLVPVIACKGCMEYKVTFRGKAVHSSSMPKGINAITNCTNFISDLTKFYEEIKVVENNNFDIPFTTMNIATINGGKCINIVPDMCTLTFDFRTVYNHQHNKIDNNVRKLLEKYDCNMEIITNVYPNNNNDSKNVKYIENITGNKAVGFNYVTEGNFLENKNVVILGPGPVTAHEVNEHISISSYTSTIDLYKKIIYNFCGGKDE